MGLRAIIQNDVIVDDGFFEEKYVLGVPGDGFAVAQDAMMFCRLGIAAESIGIMKRCFQLMLQYSGRRNISTGRLLDNSVTINRMEDILLATGALESLVFGISKILDANEQVPIEAYAACKILGPGLAWCAADRLVQCLGGRGYTETNVAPRILRDTRLLRIFEGPTETLQMFLGSRVVLLSEPIYSWLISQSGDGQIAGRLQNDVKEMMDAVGTTPVERQWMYQQVGQLAAWAIMLAFARAPQRPSSFSLSDIESWIDGQYRHILNSVRSRRAYRCVNTTTPASLAAAASLVESAIGKPNETLPAASFNLDELLLEPSAIKSVEPSYSQPNGHSAEFAHSRDGSAWIRQKVKSAVLGWLQSEINAETSEVGDDHQFGAMGVDSVSAVSLTIALERAFGTKFPDGILFQHRSVNELVSYLEREDTPTDDCEVRLAVTQKEKEAVYRLRYEVYVDEMKRPQKYADHERRWITDPLDEYADILAVWQGDRVVGTVRMNPLSRNSLDEYRHIYGLESLSEYELAACSISTRIMLAQHVRQSPVGGRLLVAAYAHGRKLGIKYDYCDCNDPVLGFFEQVGYRVIRRVEHPEYGDVSVMRLDLEDIAYLKSIRSLLVADGQTNTETKSTYS